jgi:hypothetical protein
MYSRKQMSWRYLWLLAAVGTGAWISGPLGCASSGSSVVSSGSGSTTGAGGGIGTITGTTTGSAIDAGTSGDGGTQIVDTSFLTPAWQYYNTATEKGYLEPGAPSNAKDLFSGAAATDDTIKILYPLDGTMMPSNMGYVTSTRARATRGSASS